VKEHFSIKTTQLKVLVRDRYIPDIGCKSPSRIHTYFNTATRRNCSICRERGLSVYLAYRERLQGPWLLKLVGHTVGSKP
jgi:hypothetical protein